MKTLYLTFLLVFASSLCFSQQECGTLDIDPNEGLPVGQPQLANFAKSIDFGRMFFINYVVFLPVSGQSSANEEIFTNSAYDRVDALNTAFASIGIDFEICDVTIVWNDVLSETSLESNHSIYEPYINPKAINIFAPWTITDAGGFSPLFFRTNSLQPINQRRFFVTASASDETVIHEMGHFFGLYHPHRGYHHSNGLDAQYRELVNGSNCSTHGDEICDTPADPKLNNPSYMTGCSYIGTVQDANGDLFTPDTDLYMSYTNNFCRTRFSNGQLGYMYDRIYNYTYNQHLVVPHATCELNDNTGWVMNNNTIHPNGYSANCFIPYDDQPNDSPKNFYSYYVVSNVEFGQDNDIQFQAIKQVQMNPGFKISASNNNKFKAHIGVDCINYTYPWNWHPVDNNFFKMAPNNENTNETIYEMHEKIIKESRKKLSSNLEISIIPNPNSGKFNFSVNQVGGNLTIQSFDGKTIFEKEAISSREELIDLSNFPSGIYFARYKSLDNQVISKRILIN